MAFKGKKLLVIAPHADDESQGCGGTIARALAEGAEVAVVVVSVADLAQYGHGHAMVSGATRRQELESAMRILGVERWAVLFDDVRYNMRLDTIAMVELVSAIERGSELSLDAFRPDMVLIPAPSYNQDHEIVYKAGVAACRPHLRDEKHFVSHVLCYEQPQLRWGSDLGNPNVYVDISGFLDLKIAACAAHRSQAKAAPHNASTDNIANLARLRGSDISTQAAEAFHCLRHAL